jgi:hypothetical protein
MDADELPPGHGLCALRGWRDAIALEDVTDRLIAKAWRRNNIPIHFGLHYCVGS